MFKRVRENVLEATDRAQKPWEATSIEGEFFFTAGAAVVNEAKDAVADRGPSETAEIAFWNSIKDSNNKAVFEDYISRFP